MRARVAAALALAGLLLGCGPDTDHAVEDPGATGGADSVDDGATGRAGAEAASELLPAEPTIARSFRTVVVDAGHGGEDDGAHGVSGSREKDVTLATSRKLAKELRGRGFTVIETRATDETVELARRTELANASGAGLFVSIHANSAPNTGARGIETYSMDLASDESALRLAERENRALAVLTAAGARSERRPDEQLVEDLRHGANAEWSRDLGRTVHAALVGGARGFFGRGEIKDRGHRSGPFWVLLDVEIPSILVELGYLTEEGEEQRIRSAAFQEVAAAAIADGVEAWVARAEEAEKGRPE